MLLLDIAGRFTLEDSVAAHELVESGTKLGTVVVEAVRTPGRNVVSSGA